MAHADLARSPLAPRRFPKLHPVDGLRLLTDASQSRYVGRDDFLLAVLPAGSAIAGVFTRSSMPSVAVDLCRQHLRASKGTARAIIVNAGIANAFTGRQGAQAVHAVIGHAAALLGAPSDQIYMASTGVIGMDLDPAPLCASLDKIISSSPARDPWLRAANAIRTTDTFAKAASRQVKWGRHMVSINVIAKGSGMIAPDMATMLAFGFTDADIPPRILQALLDEVNPKTFSAVTVDSDTSTSDTLLLCATRSKKLTGAPLRSVKDARLKPFRAALQEVMEDVAKQIARDGEGAQKLITIDVSGAENDQSARRIALAIANSPLVKTAVAGEDANWGRIVMAVGKSGERADRDRLSIKIGGHPVARNGRAIAGYDERPIAKHMRGRAIDIAVNVGVAKGPHAGTARVWTCDLTHGYIAINADYRS